jgi:hypothetical protein
MTPAQDVAFEPETVHVELKPESITPVEIPQTRFKHLAHPMKDAVATEIKPSPQPA